MGTGIEGMVNRREEDGNGIEGVVNRREENGNWEREGGKYEGREWEKR